MVTRSAFKRSLDTWSSDAYNIMPPWCSSVAFLLSCNTQKKYFVTYLSKSETLSIQKSMAIEECSHRMSALTLELHRAERALRHALRVRKTMFSQNIIKEPAIQYISGAKVVQGSATIEWGGSVTLWGVVRLWRASPPPDTVLSVRPPTPADCWPFRGSYGEMIIQLPRRYLVERLSLEHVRPDTARSAPKRFTLHGILDNGTWVKSMDAEYVYNKPPKQYFVLATRSVPLQQLVFRVLSNHGNTRYTCVYRVHLYTKLTQNNRI